MGSLFKPSSTTSTTNTVSRPWDEAVPYIRSALQGSNAARSVGKDPWEEAALSATAGRAMTGSPLLGLGQDMVGATAAGAFQGSNPFLDAMFERSAAQVAPNINAMFSKSGRYGSGAHADAMSRGLNDLATDMYGGAYESERSRMFDAAKMAPYMASQDYTDLDRLMSAGTGRRGLETRQLDEFINRVIPFMGVGGSSTSSQPMYGPSPFESAMSFLPLLLL